MVFISHKLGEVRSISDRVSVMRRGQMVGTAPGDTDEREFAKALNPGLELLLCHCNSPIIVEVRGLLGVQSR